jgi:uncharacterized membrane protein YhaH (DUF805 family)
MNWYIGVLKNYAGFSGRARRKEYWMFILFNMIFALVLAAIDSVLGTYPVIYSLYCLAVFIPALAVLVRRLHDIGKSGAWFFILFIPIIGGIWLLVLLCTEGNHGTNIFGEDPKTEEQTVGV